MGDGRDGRRPRVHKAAVPERGIADERRGRNLLGALAPAHQIGNLVYFHQAIHTGPEAELVAMLLGAKVAIAAHTKPAERFPTKLADTCVHRGVIIGALPSELLG